MSETQQAPPQKPPRHRAVSGFLSGDRTPMWFTLLMLSAGAAGTYYLAPRVNAEFEAQKIKTDFVIRNYSDLRTKMEDLQGLFTTMVQKVVAGDDIRADLYRLTDIVGRINAQNVSLLPIFTREEGPKATSEISAALNEMLTVLFENAGRKFTTDEELMAFNKQVVAASTKLVPPILELYVRIGEVGRLNPTEKDVDLSTGIVRK